MWQIDAANVMKLKDIKMDLNDRDWLFAPSSWRDKVFTPSTDSALKKRSRAIQKECESLLRDAKGLGSVILGPTLMLKDDLADIIQEVVGMEFGLLNHFKSGNFNTVFRLRLWPSGLTVARLLCRYIFHINCYF